MRRRVSIEAREALLLARRAASALSTLSPQPGYLAQVLAAGTVTIDFKNGNDANDGITAPLLTWRAFRARIGDNPECTNLTIRLLNGPNDPSDRIGGEFTVLDNHVVSLVASPIVIPSSGSVTITPRNRATKTPWTVSLPSSLSPFFLQSIRYPSRNARHWVTATTGATTARTTEPMSIQTPPATSNALVVPSKATPVSGDAFVVEEMQPLYLGSFKVDSKMTIVVSALTQPGLLVLNGIWGQCAEPTVFLNAATDADTMGVDCDESGFFLAQECRFDQTILLKARGAKFYNCLCTGGIRGNIAVARDLGATFFGGGNAARGLDGSGNSNLDHDTRLASMNFDGDFLFDGTTALVWGAGVWFGTVGFFNGDDGLGIIVYPEGSLHCSARLDNQGPVLWGDSASTLQGSAPSPVEIMAGGLINYQGDVSQWTLSSGGSAQQWAFAKDGVTFDTALVPNPATGATAAGPAQTWSNLALAFASSGYGGAAVGALTGARIAPAPQIR